MKLNIVSKNVRNGKLTFFKEIKKWEKQLIDTRLNLKTLWLNNIGSEEILKSKISCSRILLKTKSSRKNPLKNKERKIS